MNKVRLIPRLAATGIRKNGIVYAPYLLTTAFAVAVFFVFGCIIDNPVMEYVPHAKYAVMMLETGKVLLGIILIPFLFYTNSFLIRRRKKELGLYTILGLEKKHVAIMMFLETVMTYLFSIATGVVAAVVFGRLIFAFLLRVGVPAAGADGIYDEQGKFFGYGGVFCHRVSDESGCKSVAGDARKAGRAFAGRQKGRKSAEALRIVYGVRSAFSGSRVLYDIYLQAGFLYPFEISCGNPSGGCRNVFSVYLRKYFGAESVEA